MILCSFMQYGLEFPTECWSTQSSWTCWSITGPFQSFYIHRLDNTYFHPQIFCSIHIKKSFSNLFHERHERGIVVYGTPVLLTLVRERHTGRLLYLKANVFKWTNLYKWTITHSYSKKKKKAWLSANLSDANSCRVCPLCNMSSSLTCPPSPAPPV